MPTFGFETETWTIAGYIAVVQGAFVYEGDKALRFGVLGGATPQEATAQSPTVNVFKPGLPRTLSYFVRRGTFSHSTYRIRVAHFPNGVGGGKAYLESVVSTSLSTAWTKRELTFTPNAANDAVFFETDYTGSGPVHPFEEGRFYIDQVFYGEDVITATIKQALVDDLTDINGTGIFSTTIAEVGTEPKRTDDAKKPGAFVISGQGSTSLSSLTDKLRDGTQTYFVQLVVHSDTPNADMDTFLDDARNAFERPTSNLNTINVSSIRDFKVDVNWDSPMTDQTIHEGTLIAELEVVVRYIYDAGTL